MFSTPSLTTDTSLQSLPSVYMRIVNAAEAYDSGWFQIGGLLLSLLSVSAAFNLSHNSAYIGNNVSFMYYFQYDLVITSNTYTLPNVKVTPGPLMSVLLGSTNITYATPLSIAALSNAWYPLESSLIASLNTVSPSFCLFLSFCVFSIHIVTL